MNLEKLKATNQTAFPKARRPSYKIKTIHSNREVRLPWTAMLDSSLVAVSVHPPFLSPGYEPHL